MTIEFNCPRCGALIGFADQHAGKRAHCATCKQRFFVPDKSFDPPELIAGEPEDRGQPVPGFYRAALTDSWPAVLRLKHGMALTFIAVATTFKFFTAHIDYSFTISGNGRDLFRVFLPIGGFIRLAVWGYLFWYYLEVINWSTQDDAELPEIEIDSLTDFFAKSFKSIYTFAMALFICMLPTITYLAFARASTSAGRAGAILSNAGLFMFPMLILTAGVNQDVQVMMRIDNMIKPIVRAFLPYLTCAVLVMLVWYAQMHTHNYRDAVLQSAVSSTTFLHLAAQWGIQVLALITMRSMGLFYRHYACYFKW